MKNINIVLTNEEVDFLMKVLGELPTRTGAFILLQNLQKQLQQISAQSNEVDTFVEAEEVK